MTYVWRRETTLFAGSGPERPLPYHLTSVSSCWTVTVKVERSRENVFRERGVEREGCPLKE